MADQPINLVDHTDDERDESPEQENVQEESHVDILYENQRGWFVFGIPLFSSKALWNLRIDQSPWVNGEFRPSAVNITNAQVPDPSWMWEWKTWYVDMSHDVDEEGWQYSFYFRKFAWHGNHPWFHSFVRRRRWLRKRMKLKLPPKTKENTERLFGDTFSIGTTLARSTSGRPWSLDATGGIKEEPADEEIRDIPTLMSTLKTAPIDRERIVAIKKFIDESGEDLYYLAENMPVIMSMLVFQNSRRQLLTSLMHTFNAASAHREEHKKHGEPEDEVKGRRIDNLLKAVKAADDECKKLEYWSDIRSMTENGEIVGGADDAYGWSHKWEGVDSSGPAHP